MSFLKRFALVLLLSAAFVACNKDKNDPDHGQSEKFIGKWIGTYGFEDEVSGYFFGLNIKADGTIQELNSSGAAKGEGSWTIQGNSLKGTYKMKFAPYNQYSVLVNISSASSSIMEGGWGYDTNGSDGGKILLTKQ